MRVLIALDWSEQAFAAVREASYLYDLHDVTLVHGIDLGCFNIRSSRKSAACKGMTTSATP